MDCIASSTYPATIIESLRKPQEVERLRRNAGQVIVPDVTIRSPGKDWHFQDLRVTPHDVRRDVLQPGVVTALDALINLREQGKLPTLKLTWYERIGRADPVDSCWVEQVGPDPAAGGCGFVYETGSKRYPGFSGSHIHIPTDVRVTVSPEYALWFWICLRGQSMSQAARNYWLAVLMGVLGVLVAASSFLLWVVFPRGYYPARQVWVEIHKWDGLALTIAVVIHMLLHWKWLWRVTRRHAQRLFG